MPQRKTKPKVGPNELYCEICWRFDIKAIFRSYDAFLFHLKNHFAQTGEPAKIIASA